MADFSLVDLPLLTAASAMPHPLYRNSLTVYA